MTTFGRWAALGALTLALTGCLMHGKHRPATAETTAMAIEMLTGLPSLEETTAAVRRAVDQIVDEAGRIVPGARWESLHGETTDRCEWPFDGTGGQRHYLPDRVAQNVAVSEQQWAQVEQAARRIAATAGAPTAVLVRRAPGNHEVSFVGQAGLSITIGYQGNLAISGYTGCRLPAGAPR